MRKSCATVPKNCSNWPPSGAQFPPRGICHPGDNAMIRARSIACFAMLLSCAAWAHDDDAAKSKAPLQLGKVSFPTTCNPSVQPTFERGVALLHSFWFEEAEKAFRDVLAH